MANLTQLKIGERAIIKNIKKCNLSYRHKLLQMGLTEGTELKLLRKAPLGDPLLVEVRGFSLSLRKHESIDIEIEKIT